MNSLLYFIKMSENNLASDYSLVLTEDESPVIDKDKILLQKNKDGSLIYFVITKNIVKTFGLAWGSGDSGGEYNLTQENDDSASNNGDMFNWLITSGEEPEENLTQENDDCASNNGNKFNWQHTSIMLLLDEYQKRILKFRNPKIKKKILWEEIVSVMKQKNYIVDVSTVDSKIRNMKNTYRTILDNNNKKRTTGKGQITWEYFSSMEEILQEDKTVNESPTMSSAVFCETQSNNTLSNLNEEDRPEASCSTSSGASTSCSTSATPTTKRNQKVRYLDCLRKRQLQVEEEKLQEAKALRTCLNEHNQIQREKLEVLRQLLSLEKKKKE